jgi:hypothetical protein
LLKARVYNRPKKPNLGTTPWSTKTISSCQPFDSFTIIFGLKILQISLKNCVKDAHSCCLFILQMIVPHEQFFMQTVFADVRFLTAIFKAEIYTIWTVFWGF